MGKIKKILENELAGGTQITEVYPVTSTKAVYDKHNERLDNIINRIEQSINSVKEETLEENREMISSILENYTPIEIIGDVTNAPDEEDLTSVNVGGTDVLKFKDKSYNPLGYSGLGRKILRKNIVDGVNALTQPMMQATNTIYVICYDFDLDGATIIIPANCVLEFDGGSLSNGSVVFNKTLLTGNPKISLTCMCSGSVKNDRLYVSWFGAVGDGTYEEGVGYIGTDNHPAFMNISTIINDSKGGTIVFEDGLCYTSSVERCIYKNTPPLWLKKASSVFYIEHVNYVCFQMNGATIQLATNVNNRYSVISLYCCNRAIIKNGNLIGDGKNHSYDSYYYDDLPEITGQSYELCYGICSEGCGLCIDSVNVSHCCGDAILAGSANWVQPGSIEVEGKFEIRNCDFSYCGRQGISAHNTTYSIIDNVKIHHIGKYLNNPGFSPMSGIDFEYEDQTSFLGNVVVKNCIISDTTRFSICTGKSGNEHSKMLSFIIKDCVLDGGIDTSHIKAISNGRILENSKIKLVKKLNDYSNCAFDSIINSKLYVDAEDNEHTLVYLTCPNINNTLLSNNNNAGSNKVVFSNSITTCFYNCHIIGFKGTSDNPYIGFDGTLNSGAKLNINIYDSIVENTDLLTSNNQPDENIYKNTIFKNCFIGSAKTLNAINCTFINCQGYVTSSSNDYLTFNCCSFINNSGLISGLSDYVYAQALHSLQSSHVMYNNCIIMASVQAVVSEQTWNLSIPAVYNNCIFKNEVGNVFRTTYPYMIDSVTKNIQSANSGTFNNKPSASDIYVGFSYFCTDKQTVEGATAGIEIYYKGQDVTDTNNPKDVWVDALGRVVS